VQENIKFDKELLPKNYFEVVMKDHENMAFTRSNWRRTILTIKTVTNNEGM